jgi:hypothetical protein
MVVGGRLGSMQLSSFSSNKGVPDLDPCSLSPPDASNERLELSWLFRSLDVCCSKSCSVIVDEDDEVLAVADVFLLLCIIVW